MAAARGVSAERVREILTRAIETPALGFFGQPRLNVLLLNLDLDAAFAAASE